MTIGECLYVSFLFLLCGFLIAVVAAWQLFLPVVGFLYLIGFMK